MVEFWQIANDLDRAGHPDDALDILFNTIDDMYCLRGEEAVDAWLDKADVSAATTQCLVGALAITNLANSAERMPSREGFVERAEARLREIETPERVERLLRGLR